MKIRIFDAEYTESTNPPWQGNPLIEALTPMLETRVFAHSVTNKPPFDPSECLLSNHERLSRLCRVEGLFIPFPHHVTLYQRIARAICVGYEKRNPVDDPTSGILSEKVERFSNNLKYGIAPYESESVQGFALTGISGVGKSTAINSVFRLYPQVLTHREYHGQPLNFRQLVWLKLSCPEDGSLKALCISFFKAIDTIFNQGFAEKYAKNSYSVAQMVPHFARVAGLVHLGVLVIDEIQALSARDSQGRDVMLGFFTRLANEIGIPVILVGTPEARTILEGALQQIRRNSGQGDMMWGAVAYDQERINNNQEWTNFAKNLWDYQFVGKKVTYSDELGTGLHSVSQGILGFATKIFIVAQERAINNQLEEITPELLKTVSEQDFTSAVEKLQKMFKEKKDGQKAPSTVPSPQPDKPHGQRRSKKPTTLEPESSGPMAQESIGSPEMLQLAKSQKGAGQSVYTALEKTEFIKNGREFLE